MPTTPPDLDRTTCLRAHASKDARFDGRFFAAVHSTRIYCRPICPARTPRPERLTFFATATAAEQAGYRPCLRCRPETAPGSPAWCGTATTVARAVRLIEQGALDEGSVETLAARLGVGGRHLRRLLVEQVGATPLALAQTRRLHFARRLLVETELPISIIAGAAGFKSLRRLNSSFREAFRSAPVQMRRDVGRTRPSEHAIALQLNCRPPFDGAALLAFLGPRAIAGCERVDADTWSAVVREGDAKGIVRVRVNAKGVTLAAPVEFTTLALRLVARARNMFDLDADPHAIGEQLRGDALLEPLVRRRPGLRVPGAWDAFPMAVRAILGQQVSVAAASTLGGRIAAAFGEPIDSPQAGLDRVFPSAATLAEAPLERVGVIGTRARAIRALAQAVASGHDVLEPAPDLGTALARLTALPGIGPWTASYIAMRALREPDAFPTGDLVLGRAIGGGSQHARELRTEPWRPFRAYAAMHLWMKG